jgi:signal transduction histidine kinase
MFLVPSVFTWGGQLVSRLRGLDSIVPCAIGFCFSGVITLWAFHRWRLYSILPLAKDVVVEGMVDGLMVIDDEGYIVALNTPTRTIFADSAISIGKTIEDALQAWPEMVCRDNSASVWETQHQQGDAVSYYQVTRTSLRISTAHVLGQVLVFKDITHKKLQQARIVEQERALAMMTERERLGRELHDGQGQVWSYLSLTTQMLRTMLAQEKYEQADQELVRLLEVVQEMHTEFRESIYGLQSSVSAGLIYALDGQLEWYRKYCGLDVVLELHCEWRRGMLTPAGEAHLLRIVQEAMVNIRKSAQASRVQVIFERMDEALQVLVEDNGCGFEVARTLVSVEHHGLGIMRERAEEMGGRLEVESHPGCGTKVRLTVPLAGKGWGNTLQ